jgi:hypothetical protein
MDDSRLEDVLTELAPVAAGASHSTPNEQIR